MLSHYKELVEELESDWEIKLIAVGSEGNCSRRLATRNGWEYLEHPNKPYWKKFNCGVRFAQDWEPDFVMATGSDEIVNRSLFDSYKTAIDYSCVNFLGTLDYYIFDTIGRRIKFWKGYTCKRSGETAGPWRMLGKDLLDQLDWTLYDETAGAEGMFIDGSMELRLAKCKDLKRKVFRCREINAKPIQMKCEISLNDYGAFEGESVKPKDYLPKAIMEKWPC
jgi:hypothetical protein